MATIKREKQLVAGPEIIEAVRIILGMNTMGGEERKEARREARHTLRMWLYKNNLAPRQIVPKPKATVEETDTNVRL